jgi:hypothetical protein
MPLHQRGDVRIRYEEVGSGFPLLVTPGGGLNSRVSNWQTANSTWATASAAAGVTAIVFAGEPALGVLLGVALGVVLSLIVLAYRTTHPPGALVVRHGSISRRHSAPRGDHFPRVAELAPGCAIR